MKTKLGLALSALLLLTACGPSGTPTAVADLLASNTPEEAAAEDSATPQSLDAEDSTLSPTPQEVQETATSAGAPSIPNPDDYAWVQVASGFAQPLLVTNAGDGSGRLFIVGQTGTIHVIENGQVLAAPFLDISSRVGSTGNEQGLLGLAFHPDFAENGYFYLNYTNQSGNTMVARFSTSADPNLADPDSETTLLQVSQPYANHNGGHLEFGPDGYLYIGLGDGGSGGDPGGNGQNTNTLLGALLRIDVDGGDPYGIPADNPFVNGGGAAEIWAYGLRNPWRYSFDRLTGDLYVADVGQNQWEEVNFLPGGVAGGANFGWNYYEATHAYQGTPPNGANLIAPVAEYDHGSGCSITGGLVYRGAALPAWNGVYFYGDFCSGTVWGLVQDADGQWQSETIYNLGINITSFGMDENGEIYVLDRNGNLYQLRGQ